MKIAIIGGIGSGKSAVVHIISGLGEVVCDCDAIYKEISTTKEYIDIIDKHFGVVKKGIIDKKALADIVFSDEEKLELLNSLAHPLVFERLDKLSEQCKGNLYIEVSAFDMSMQDRFDKFILVEAPKDTRIERIVARSNHSMDIDTIAKILQCQLSINEMQKIADYVIVNDSSKEVLKERVKAVVDSINNTSI